MPRIAVTLIPAFSDNYVYLIEDRDTGALAVVDPGDAAPVREHLAKRAGKLSSILLTHHHADHVGGAEELAREHRCKVYGPRADMDRVPAIDTPLDDGDRIQVGGLTARVIDVPGHTRNHIALFFEEGPSLFAGDTLFALGCGRLFEGTPQQMWSSLKRLRELPDTTRLYCGHEYTLSNARFAVSIDPSNATLEAYAEDIRDAREAGAPTIPAQLGREKLANPFLRADHPAMKSAMGMPDSDPAEVFGEIRRRKDNF